MTGRKGFTILEVVIVVIIIAILAAIGYPRMGDMFQGYREIATKSSLNSLRAQISAHHDKIASWPVVADLDVPVNSVTTFSKIKDDINTKPDEPNDDIGWFYLASRGHVWAANNLDW